MVPAAYAAYAVRAASRFRAEAPSEGSEGRDRFGVRVFALHATGVVLLGFRDGRAPIENGAELLGALSLAAFGVFLFASRDGKARALGAFVAGFCVVATAGAVAAGVGGAIDREPRGAVFVVHATTAVFATAVMGLSGCAGCVYLLLDRQMRRRTFGRLYRGLPNLADLAALNRRAAAVGFLAMTVGVNWGIWLAHKDGVAGFSYLDPQVLASFALWLHFGVIALPPRVVRVSGARAAKAATAGLVLLFLTLALSTVPGLSFHRFS
jgi:ABC-type uncharacterized transport system permease subunit